MSGATITPEQQAALTAAINDEFERTASLRKVIPEVSMPGAIYGVVVPCVNGSTLSMSDYSLIKPVTLSIEVSIAPMFSTDLDAMLTLVRAATKRIAIAEDRVIAYGSLATTFVSESTNTCTVTDTGVTGTNVPTQSLFGSPASSRQFSSTPANSLSETIVPAMAALVAGGYTQPYAASYGPSAWSSVAAASASSNDPFAMFAASILVPGSSVTNNSVISGAQTPTAEASAAFFDMSSLGCDLVRVSKPSGTMRGYDTAGSMRYFVEEQFLLRVKDDRSIFRVWATGTEYYYKVPHPPS